MPKLASRRVVLQLVATAAMFTAVPVVGPAVAADPSQIVQNTAQQVIEIVGTQRQNRLRRHIAERAHDPGLLPVSRMRRNVL